MAPLHRAFPFAEVHGPLVIGQNLDFYVAGALDVLLHVNAAITKRLEGLSAGRL